MSQSLAKILVHLTFSTKERRPLIRDEERGNLHAYMMGVLENLKSPSLQTNSVKDHVHILFALSKNHSLAHVIGEVNESSSAWIKKEDPWYRDLLLARRICGILGERVAGGGGAAIYSEAAGASQNGFVSG